MTVSGFQDFWVAGSRFIFQRDPVAGVEQPWVDLGIIQPANPSLDVSKVELKDSDGGVRVLADSTVTDLTESYSITCSNMNLENWALLLLGASPTSFTQTATEKPAVSHYVHPGRLLKLKDSDAAGTLLYGLGCIAGVYKGSTTAILKGTGNFIVASTKTIKVVGDQSANAALAVGKCFIVQSAGLTNVLNSRTYTVVSKSYSAPDTSIVVAESPVADEAAAVGQQILTEATPGTDVIYKPDGVDWSIVDLNRGLIKMISGGAFATAGTLKVCFTTATLSGVRLMNPQTASQIKGKGVLIYGRGNRTDETVREARISITPDSASVTDDDYSNMTFTVSVLSDPTSAIPAGRMLAYKGSIPSLS